MAEEIKKMFVRIGGMSYQLVTTENEQYTRQIAAKADEMIHRVMQNNPQLSQNMATVLALVNAVDELNGLYQRLGSVDGQKAETEKQASEARKELMRLREQNWEMKKEILRLNEINKYNQALIGKLTTPGDLVSGQVDRDAAPVSGQTGVAAGTAPAPEQAEVQPVSASAAPAPSQGDTGKAPAPEKATEPQQAAPLQQIKPKQEIRQPSSNSAEQPAPGDVPGTAKMVAPLQQEISQAIVPDLKSNRTDAKSGQAGVTLVGELKQTNLDDYLKANGWPQTYETKKHD